jgi:hypothetical protein
MIKVFDTTPMNGNGGNGGATPKKGGMNTLLVVGALLVGGYLVYRYVLKPKMDAKKEQEQQNAEN